MLAPAFDMYYAKMGYGEVSEHTVDDALRVVLGTQAMPLRPIEDAAYARSEQLRAVLWNR